MKVYLYHGKTANGWPTYAKWFKNIMEGSGDRTTEDVISEAVGRPIKIQKYKLTKKELAVAMDGNKHDSIEYAKIQAKLTGESRYIELPDEEASMFLLKWS